MVFFWLESIKLIFPTHLIHSEKKKRSPDRGIHFFLPKVNGDFTCILISPGAVTRSSRSLIAVATGFSLFTPICPLSVVFRRTWTRQAVPNSSRIVDLVVGKRKMSCTHVTFPKSGLEVCKKKVGNKQKGDEFVNYDQLK